MKFTTRSLMFMTLSILSIGEAMEVPRPPCKHGEKCYQKNLAHLEKFSHPEKRLDQGYGPFKLTEFIEFYKDAAEAERRWSSPAERGEKRLDGSVAGGLKEFIEFYKDAAEAATSWHAAKPVDDEKRFDGADGPFTLKEFIDFYKDPAEAATRWHAAKAVKPTTTPETTVNTFTGDAIKKNCPNKDGKARGSTTAEVKKFSFTKKGFTLKNALDFEDPDFQNYFISSFIKFAEEHTDEAGRQKHIWFELKPIENNAALATTCTIEWVLVASKFVHEFATKGRKAPYGGQFEAFKKHATTEILLHVDGKEVPMFNRDLKSEYGIAGQTCSTRLAFGIIKKGASGVVRDERQVYPCDMGRVTGSGKRVTGLRDVSGREDGGRCLNMANFFRQSTKEDVIELMKATFLLAKEKLKTRQNMHVYSFGGSRPWLHMRCESDAEMRSEKVNGHYLWYK